MMTVFGPDPDLEAASYAARIRCLFSIISRCLSRIKCSCAFPSSKIAAAPPPVLEVVDTAGEPDLVLVGDEREEEGDGAVFDIEEVVKEGRVMTKIMVECLFA